MKSNIMLLKKTNTQVHEIINSPTNE